LAGVAALPLAARAQQSERLRTIAVLLNANETDPEIQRRFAAFRRGLNALGWIEGKNIKIETRWGVGDADRVQRHARDLVALAPDILFSNGTPATAALMRATKSIPIVFAIVADPVSDGFVTSLSRPGGNITGFSSFDSEFGGKWVELLKEVAPDLKRVALLFNPKTAPGGGKGLMRPFFDAGAKKLAVESTPMPVESVAELERSLRAHAAQPNSGLIAMPDGFLLVNVALVVRLANELRLPAVYPFRYFAANGGLLSYGVDSADLNLRAASYIDRILKGANPADLPIQTPTKFDMTINLKTAKLLGLAIPLPLQAAADHVFE
jgi:putative ABC transport system substrate-binding protein